LHNQSQLLVIKTTYHTKPVPSHNSKHSWSITG